MADHLSDRQGGFHVSRYARLVIFVVLAGFYVLPAVSPQEPTPAIPAPRPMVTVDGEPISSDEWLATLKAFSGAQALRQLIEERLVVREAHRLRIPFKDAEVDAYIARMRATEYPDEQSFTEMLHARGISLTTLRRELKTQLLLERIVDTVGKITDEAVEAYYQSHRSEFIKPTRVELYGITTSDLRTAAQAYERLANEDFSKVAQELSIDEHAAEGGFWGFLSADEISPELLRTAAFALQPGKYSEPIEADGKGYVLWVKSLEPGSETTLLEAAPIIRQRLRAEKGLSRQSVLRGIIRRAKISVLQPEYAFLEAEYNKAKELQVIVDGKPLSLRVPPFVLGTGRTLVPADPLVKALGANATWYGPPDNILQVKKGDLELVLQVGNPIAAVNRGTQQGQATLDQPPVVRDGIPFVSAKWLVEQLGGSVLFVPDEYALKIKSVREGTSTPSEP